MSKRPLTRSQDEDMAHKSHKAANGDPNLQFWQHEPPYVREDPDNKRKPLYRGHCHCKKVKYELYDEPKPGKTKYCHCRGCQKTHGSPFQWSVVYSKTDALFTEGHEYLECYNTSTGATDHSLPSKLLCTQCHSPLADEGRSMLMLFPTTLEFGDEGVPDTFKPDNHIFYGSRVLDMKDGVPKWEGKNGDSKEIPEDEVHKTSHHGNGAGGPEIVRARE